MNPTRPLVATRLYEHLLKRAKDRALLIAPPYSDEGKRSAFLAGYESALSDIARGDLDVSEVPR